MKKILDTRELLVYCLSKRTLLLELFTIIGVSNTLKLITYFSNTSLDIPSKHDIKRQIKQIYSYKLKEECGKSLYEIADMLSMQPIDVSRDIDKVKKLIEQKKSEEQDCGIKKEVLSLKELEDFIVYLDGGITKKSNE